jgi:hypothetical protein
MNGKNSRRSEIPRNEFSGEPETKWIANDSGTDREMELLKPFTYCDPDGKPWVAKAGATIDGASIPQPLWSIVGSPFTGDYRRASIVHDVACKDGQSYESRLAADKMYYHACRKGGCNCLKALEQFIGVRIGAWLPLTPIVNVYANPESLARASNDDVAIASATLRSIFRAIYRFLKEKCEARTVDDLAPLVDQHLRIMREQLELASRS